jgi:hypothetical protein
MIITDDYGLRRVRQEGIRAADCCGCLAYNVNDANNSPADQIFRVNQGLTLYLMSINSFVTPLSHGLPWFRDTEYCTYDFVQLDDHVLVIKEFVDYRYPSKRTREEIDHFNLKPFTESHKDSIIQPIIFRNLMEGTLENWKEYFKTSWGYSEVNVNIYAQQYYDRQGTRFKEFWNGRKANYPNEGYFLFIVTKKTSMFWRHVADKYLTSNDMVYASPHYVPNTVHPESEPALQLFILRNGKTL